MGLGKKTRNRAQVLRGRARRSVGNVTGNRRLKAQGRADIVMGTLKNAGQKVKDAVKK